jgi:hypothetical protein
MDKQGKTKPGLKPQVIDGQLVHYVAVGGKPVQGHTSLKAAICALALAMALTGCESTQTFIKRHPVASGVIAGSLALSARSALKSHGDHGPEVSTPLIATPEVDCSSVSCR